MKPNSVINGLAVYRIGRGKPVFVMPYPHAATFVSIADDSLTNVVLATGRSVITFDPPGAYNSTRKASSDMKEMLDCINETLDYFNIYEKIDFVGHSMGGFCLLAYITTFQERIKKAVFIGVTTGWSDLRKYGIHTSWKWWKDKEFWQSRFWGTKIFLGFNDLKTYTKLNNIVEKASYVDQKYVHLFPIEKKDGKKALPARGKWLENVRRYDYKEQLHLIRIPILICVGLYDRQTPVVMNKKLKEGIINSRLVIFNQSGHSPFIEEKDTFIKIISDFLK